MKNLCEYVEASVKEVAAAMYTARLKEHIERVQEAAVLQLGMGWDEIGPHDSSKWGEAEFWPYALKFCWPGNVGQSPLIAARIDADFDRAWLHHLHNNPHHWQYWLLQYDSGPHKALPMPPLYAREMVADWLGASKAYTGSWDMTKWLRQNMGRIWLHPETAEFVRGLLDHCGYADLINLSDALWAHELAAGKAG